MMSIFAILVVVVLNLVPADVTTFTMQMNPAETMRFTKQGDGGWSAIKLPRGDDLGTFYVDGTKLTMKGEGKERTQDLAKILGVDEGFDWKEMKAVKLGATPVQVERQSNGLDFVLREKKEDSPAKPTFKVRWDLKELK